MSQFPDHLSVIAPAPVVCPLSACAVPFIAKDLPAGAAWPTANKAIFYPFRISTHYVVRRLWSLNGATVTGTIDLGIYTRDFTRMASTGPTTQAGANNIQAIAINPSELVLAPGDYYMAAAASATTDHFFRLTPWANAMLLRLIGVLEQTTAMPLPALATPVGITSNYMPMFGFSSRTLV